MCNECKDTGYCIVPFYDDCRQVYCNCAKGKELDEEEDLEWWDRIFRILRL